MLARLFEHSRSSNPLFSTTCTQPFSAASQPPDSKALAQSIENIWGYTPILPKVEGASTEHARLSGLVFFFSPSQDTGSHGGRKRRAPEPREAHIKLAEAWIEVNRNSHPVADRERMRRRGKIRRKVVQTPRQDRPHADHDEEKHQRQHKKHVPHGNHVR